MTPDPEADAALDVWFGNRNWRSATPPETKDSMRARMRRVLDAHDAKKAMADERLFSAAKALEVFTGHPAAIEAAKEGK